MSPSSSSNINRHLIKIKTSNPFIVEYENDEVDPDDDQEEDDQDVDDYDIVVKNDDADHHVDRMSDDYEQYNENDLNEPQNDMNNDKNTISHDQHNSFSSTMKRTNNENNPLDLTIKNQQSLIFNKNLASHNNFLKKRKLDSQQIHDSDVGVNDCNHELLVKQILQSQNAGNYKFENFCDVF
jgi:hypothetical protein